MVNYSKGLVYKLCCNDTNITDIYVGSTTNFIRRKCAHKSACTNPNNKSYNYHVYNVIRDNGDWSNWSMILLREYNTTNKKLLERKERKYIEKLGATLNSNTPSRTINEVKELTSKRNRQYQEANKEVISEQRKEYRKRNKDVIKERNHQYYEANKKQIIEQVKQYNKTNKEHIIEQKKEYYKENKEKLSQRKKEKIKCERGCEVIRNHIARHKKSNKHKDLMEEQ